MAGLHKFNHAGSRDTSSYAHFKQAYFELYEANYNAASMQSVATFKTVINQSLASKRIPIGAIYYNFNIIDTLALRNNLLSIQNELLYDVANRPRIPYLPHQTLVVAALTESVQAGAVNFVFNSNFIKSNTGLAITSINVHFGDDNGTTATIVPGSTVYTAYYGGEGLKTLRYTINFSNGSQQTTYSTLNVNGFASNNSCYNCATAAYFKPCNAVPVEIESTLAFQGYNETVATKGKAELSYYYASCSSPVLRKPILLLDGFDPGDDRSGEELYNEYLPYGGSGQNLGEDMRALGYDVVVINFHKYTPTGALTPRDGGADYIERNAFVLIKIIQDLNAKLQQNGSTEKLVVIGPSMGGLISRYALAYMEKNSMNHNTRLWVSFDSPHLGANIPIGDQQYFNYYRKISDGAQEALDLKLGSPAAKQMLLHHYLAGSVQPAGAPNFRQRFQLALDNIGFPTNLRKISLVNGSQKGLTQPVGSPCELALNSRVDAAGWIRLGVKLFFMKFFPPLTFVNIPISEATVRFAPRSNGTCQVFYGNYFAVFGPNSINAQNPSYSRESLDLGPGGTFDTQQQIKNQGKIVGKDRLFVKTTFPGVVPNHTFIPTASALAYRNNPNRNWSDDVSNINLVCTKETPFDAYYAPTQNEEHVQLTDANVAFVKNEIKNGPPINPCAPLPISASISGPTSLSLAAPSGTWTVNPTGGTGSYSYQWYVRGYVNGSAYSWSSPSSTINTLTQNMGSYQEADIRVDITSGTQQASFYYHIYCSNCCSGCDNSFTIGPNPTSETFEIIREDQSTITAQTSSSTSYPNQFNNFEVKLYNEYSQIVRIGKSNQNKVKLDVKELPEGMYYIHIRSGTQVIKKQVIISKP